MDSKAYLSGGEAKQNIDAGRIVTADGQRRDHDGGLLDLSFRSATFSETNVNTVDENAVKAVPDHPRPMAKKKKKM